MIGSDCLLLKCVASRVGGWESESRALYRHKASCVFAEVRRNRRGPPRLPELHSVHGDRGVRTPGRARQGDELHGEYARRPRVFAWVIR